MDNILVIVLDPSFPILFANPLAAIPSGGVPHGHQLHRLFEFGGRPQGREGNRLLQINHAFLRGWCFLLGIGRYYDLHEPKL